MKNRNIYKSKILICNANVFQIKLAISSNATKTKCCYDGQNWNVTT